MNSIRPRPDDFAIDVTEADAVVSAYGRFPKQDGTLCNISLGFRRTRDEAENARLLENLKESMWQASELVRLGRLDELRGFIIPATP